MKKSDAFTGLEAGLVLLAFVVVASVFSYVILSAGFFAVQKSQEVVYSAVEQSSSTMILGNDLFGYKNESTGNIDRIRLSAGSPYALMPIDLGQVSIHVVNRDLVKKIEKADPLYSVDEPPVGTWRIIKNTGGLNAGSILSMGDYATIIINLPEDMQISPGEYFRISILPPLGAPLFAERTAPLNFKETVIFN